MAKSMVQILEPVADQANPLAKLAPRPRDLNGKVVALLDDNLTNVDILLAALEKLLSRRFQLAGIVWYNRVTTEGEEKIGGVVRKTSGEDLPQVAAKSHLAITGVGD
ncbi:MAG: hypothetical protein HYU29_09375 [Chloroflexi bacterium]|nr:hypothetical protein [Chloroflexota bacterium]